jgi:hypothetical protein
VGKEGAVLALAGVVIGAPGIYFARQSLCGWLVGASANDLLTLLGATGVLQTVAVAGCCVPLRKF